MGTLEKVSLNPNKSVTFEPSTQRQCVDLVVDNSSEAPIIFKMKSTRPGVYKMKPVYGVVKPNDKFTVKLILKGLKGGTPPANLDRFTIVMGIAPSMMANAEKMWKQHKYHNKIVGQEMTKKRLTILYTGVNDNIELPTDIQNSYREKKKERAERSKGEAEEKSDNKKNDRAAASCMTAVEPPKPKGPGVLLMYRDREESNTDDDDEETGCPPVEAFVIPGLKIKPREKNRDKRIEVSPRALGWDASAAIQTLTITNTKNSGRVAIKVMISNTAVYVITPVFQALEPGHTATIKVDRKAAEVKNDKLVVCVADMDTGTDPAAIFKRNPPNAINIDIPLVNKENCEKYLKTN